MSAPKLSEVRHEYEELFDSCVITQPLAVQEIVNAILKSQIRYENTAAASGVPWYVIAVIHNMECSLSFKEHLHNGDPLSKKTVNVPAGRPPKWTGTGTWEESALDALQYDGLPAWGDWSLAGSLYKLEAYNGWGSRAHGIHTPYLWCFTNHYSSGKYVSDGVWNPDAVSKQCGCGAVLRRLAEMGKLSFGEQPLPSTQMPPPVRYAITKPTDSSELTAARNLQQWLSSFSGVFVAVDGWAGKKTSDAFKVVTGHFLLGDPRA